MLFSFLLLVCEVILELFSDRPWRCHLCPFSLSGRRPSVFSLESGAISPFLVFFFPCPRFTVPPSPLDVPRSFHYLLYMDLMLLCSHETSSCSSLQTREYEKFCCSFLFFATMLCDNNLFLFCPIAVLSCCLIKLLSFWILFASCIGGECAFLLVLLLWYFNCSWLINLIDRISLFAFFLFQFLHLRICSFRDCLPRALNFFSLPLQNLIFFSFVFTEVLLFFSFLCYRALW